MKKNQKNENKEQDLFVTIKKANSVKKDIIIEEIETLKLMLKKRKYVEDVNQNEKVVKGLRKNIKESMAQMNHILRLMPKVEGVKIEKVNYFKPGKEETASIKGFDYDDNIMREIDVLKQQLNRF